MVVICELAGDWHIPVAVLELPLEKGMPLRVDAAAMLGPLGQPLKRKGEVACRLLAWQYRVVQVRTTDSDGAGPADLAPATMDLELLVEEEPVKRFGPWLERQYARLTPDHQSLAPILMAMLVIFTSAMVAFLVYESPQHGLAFVGRYIRRVVGWLILLLFLYVFPEKLGLLSSPQAFRKNFFFAMMNYTGYALVFLWLHFTMRPDGFNWSDQSLADYARGLGTALSHSYWPLIGAALPWLSVAFRLFGLDFAEKTAEGFEKISKKERS